MNRRSNLSYGQQGLSLIGFLFVAFVLVGLAILAMKIVPTYVEYASIKKAIASASAAGSTPKEIQNAFNRQRDAGYISSVSGQDLEITRTSSGYEVSVAYQKKIELFGPASLVIDYAASSGSSSSKTSAKQ
jgi:Tfp pilus assembly major pilin PilA